MIFLGKTKVIFDTDIGSDIDDAVALAYLLMQERCDLLGVTTVSGEGELRAQMCSAIMKAAGKEAPIFPGVEVPMLTPVLQPKCSQYAMMGEWAHDTEFAQNAAVDFLRDAILANPGEVTLLAVGPMTNIGLLFATYPEVAEKLGALVLMCGRFGNALPRMPLREWNALNDPYASAIVYNAPVKVHRSVGLDVTMQVVMNAKQVAEKFTHPVLKPVLDFSKVWFERTERMTFHDPLAAVSVFEDVCGWERGDTSILLSDKETMGMTAWKPCENGRHEAAMTVDADRFFEHYFSMFS